MTEPRLMNSLTGEPMATRLVELAPGQWTAAQIDARDVPRFGLVRLMRQTDGSYIPILKSHGQYARMSHDLPDKLGLQGFSVKSLYRLMAAGFVGSSRPSPNGIMVDLASLADHIEQTRDPEFWTPERRARWSTACAEIH